MADDLVNPDDISVPMLQAMFDAAMMETKIDDDGDLHVRDDEIGCFIIPTKNKQGLQLMALFGAKDGANPHAKLSFVNRINDKYRITRASVRQNGGFCFDYYIPIEGSITKRNIVLTTKRFLAVTVNAIRESDTDDVVK